MSSKMANEKGGVMGDMRVSGDQAQGAAEAQYQQRLLEIQKRGGAVVQDPPNPAIGWELAARLSEDRGKIIEELHTLEGRVSGCNGSKKKVNPFESGNGTVSKPEPVVVDEGMALPPPKYWIGVSAGEGSTCGLANTGEGFCWGGLSVNTYFESDYLQKNLVPSDYDHLTPFKSVVVGGDSYNPFACWLGTEDGKATCWGSTYYNYTLYNNHPLDGEYEGPFQQLTAGGHYACGLRFDNYVECWGQDEYGETVPPNKQFSQIDAGYDTTCGILKKSGAILCWGRGEDDFEIVTDDPGPFKMVSVSKVDGNDVDLCSIRTTGEVKCGGEYCPTADPGRSEFVAVSPSSPHWCVLREDGGVSCKQLKPYGGIKPWNGPEGPLIAISAGGSSITGSSASHLCGIRPWGELACWGDNDAGQLDVPWNPR